MDTIQILISGDYWHEDFRKPFSQLGVPATMVPTERIASVVDQKFHLVVLAESRRDQISQSTVDCFRNSMPDVPIVVLLGSWCEGENRSGDPLLGVNQVVWHQWETRFERFLNQLANGLKSDWHQPLTVTVSDRVREFSPDADVAKFFQGKKVLVSCEDATTFESVSDLLSIYQCSAYWAESTDVSNLSCDVICVDGNGASGEFADRVASIRSQLTDVPVTVMLNFPRQQDLDTLTVIGVQEVVSKPYTHNEFLHSLMRSMRAQGEVKTAGKAKIPSPAFLSKQKAPKVP